MTNGLDRYQDRGIKAVNEIFAWNTVSHWTVVQTWAKYIPVWIFAAVQNLAKIWGFSCMSINQPSDLGLLECIFKTVFVQN